MTTGLFIGRFQPLHLGHVSVIEKALAEVDSLIIGIGSAEKHYTADNPFTYEERKSMIERSISGHYKIVPIPDINDYSKWVDHVVQIAGEFDAVYSGNAIVGELFQKKSYTVKPIVETLYISSTAIRDMMARRSEGWKKYMPDAVVSSIECIDGIERVRKLYKHYINPVPAVDLVIKYNGGIVLIERGDGKIALPGGFMEFGESAESAAVREAKEETNLDVKLEKLLGVYSAPDRDPRTHVISITYVATSIGGQLKGGDDAKQVLVVPLEEALQTELAFDHNKILEDYASHANLRERLAELEHEQWAHWTKHMLGNLTPENIQRWKMQAETHYTALTEKEKESDRVWGDKVSNLLETKKT